MSLENPDPKDYPNIDSTVKALVSIGFNKGFHHMLKEGDDWSFIIKIHAVLEAVFTEYLTKKLNKEELSDVISNLEMSNSKNGKLAFAKALGMTFSDSETFVRRLSELRNELVHNVKNLNYSIDEEYSKNKSSTLSKKTVNCIESASKFDSESLNLVYPTR